LLIALSAMSMDGAYKLIGLLFGATVGAVLVVLGILIAAVGQMQQATLDTAVYASPFMNEAEKAKAMGFDPKDLRSRDAGPEATATHI
jgi:hypothetical protein